jgi:YegS/Rv2252/BmrU family lipid kinase
MVTEQRVQDTHQAPDWKERAPETAFATANGFSKIMCIYNPSAGKKRRLFSFGAPQVSLESIKDLLAQYEFAADFSPTKEPGHATELAAQAAKDGYDLVIAAGGDGTISEVANGLIGTDTALGTLSLGSFMNTARMLSIPPSIEEAVHMLKIGRVRRVDIGSITTMDGNALFEPRYFMESAGLGIEAEFHRHFTDLESGDFGAIWEILKLSGRYNGDLAIVTVDGRKIRTRATLVDVSNGPFTGAALPIAPDAKLDDHRLTVTLYRMSKWEIFRYFVKRIRVPFARRPREVEVYQGRKVKIETRRPTLVHADGRVFGHTPVVFDVVPGAINAVSGFPKPGESAFVERTYLTP